MNAFSVRKHLRAASAPPAAGGWVPGSFAELHAAGPERTRPRAEQELEIIRKPGLPLVGRGGTERNR